MKSIFRTFFYLRSNYVNKEGKTPILIRIYLNRERISLGSTGLAIEAELWNSDKEKAKGHTAYALAINQKIDCIRADIQLVYKRLEATVDNLSLERIKSEYEGKSDTATTINQLFDKHKDETEVQVGTKLTLDTFQKYENTKKHFRTFLKHKYGRTDLNISELTPVIIHNFEIYLITVAKLQPNTCTKNLKLLKTIVIYGQKLGLITHDPFINKRFQWDKSNRGFLTDEDITAILNKKFEISRLETVRDIFIFSCFTGLAYIDVANLKEENIVEIEGQKWIMTKRQKTGISTNIILLDIPQKIIEKYADTRKDGKLLPVLSNQKMNAYLKEIGDLCGIKRPLTTHLARHTFATMSLSKGVPIETVSKMLGHNKIQTTQIYAKITNKKLEADMLALSSKLGKFSNSMNINP